MQQKKILYLHAQEDPGLACGLPPFGPIVQRYKVEANPTQIPRQPLKLARFDRPIQAGDQACTVGDGIARQLD